MARRLFTPSSGSSSFNLERELKFRMTPPRKQQQQQKQQEQQQQQQQLVVFGERPIIPTFTRNPGVGRPPGSSTDGVFVPVSRSPVHSHSPGASPMSVQSSLPISVSAGKGSPTSVPSSPQSWPQPPQTGSRARSVSRKGTRAETNNPETGVPGGRAVEVKTRGRPIGSKNKPK
jgi:hypothetical protein